MKPSSVFLATLIFFGLFVGGQSFMNDLWQSHDVKTNTSITIDKQYDKLQKNINGNNNSLRSKIETLSTDKGGILDAASAGLLLVPQFISVLAAPLTILATTVSSLNATFAVFLPDWAATTATLIIISTVGYGIFSLALGVKS